MKNLRRDEAVILGLLSQLRGKVVRTKFVKLMYLLDNTHFEHMGYPMTGIAYHWDHFGPNAVGQAITDTLTDLAARNFVSMTQSLTPYENYANNYCITETVRPEKLPIDEKDWAFIGTIVKRFGRKSREAVVAESKRTAAVQQAQQYDVLEFVANDKIETLKQAFLADHKFAQETSQALDSQSGDWVSLEELRAEVA